MFPDVSSLSAFDCTNYPQTGKGEMKGTGRKRDGGQRSSSRSYLKLLSCNLLERRQERYKQKSQTDSFWLWGEWNISYLVSKWQSALIVHNTGATLWRGTLDLKSKKIPDVFPLHSLAIYFSLIFLHTSWRWLVSLVINDHRKTVATSAAWCILKTPN